MIYKKKETHRLIESNRYPHLNICFIYVQEPSITYNLISGQSLIRQLASISSFILLPMSNNIAKNKVKRKKEKKRAISKNIYVAVRKCLETI